MSKICLFGDSISKGIVIDEMRDRYTMTKNSFANILSEGQARLDMTNYSMLGCTISKGQSIIARHIKDVESCEVTVLEYGGNDSDHDWKEIAENPCGVHLPKTPVEQFVKSYKEILDFLTGMGKSVVMLTLPPIDQHKYFEWFSRGLDQAGILKWLGGSDEYIYRFHEIYNVKICNIASEYNIPIIDIRSAFLLKRDYSGYLCNDGIHPNEKGHQLIAEVIMGALPDIEQAVLKKQALKVGA